MQGGQPLATEPREKIVFGQSQAESSKVWLSRIRGRDHFKHSKEANTDLSELQQPEANQAMRNRKKEVRHLQKKELSSRNCATQL